MARIGEVIDGKYEILKKIGQGGMSRVYLAMDMRLNKQWAVKEIDKNSRDKNNEVIIQSLMAEANLMKKLDHPALPRIVDIIENQSTILVIMDYIEGEPLSLILEDYGAQPQGTVIAWAKQLCEVLDYLHTRKPPIIYRDMKPGNVMLRSDGNLKLIDFGIAREYKEQKLTDTVSLGTKGYAAPEQFGAGTQTDPRTDIYCLGATMYHLVTGKNPCEPPYEIYPIRHWNPALSGGLEKIILKCTKFDPDERYQSCAELLWALEHYEEADDEYREVQKKKLKKFLIPAISCFLCLIIGITGLILRANNINSDYNSKLTLAQKTGNINERADVYLQAIDIKPTQIDAYLGIIEGYKEEAFFTVAEEKEFKKKLNANLEILRQQGDYAKLAFEIGKLYWYYYDYGSSEETKNNQLTRMKSALQWFDDAVKYGKTEDSQYGVAKVYSAIGAFNRDITKQVEEASDAGIYIEYWDSLKEFIDFIITNESNEIVELEGCKLAIYSMETYARKFKADNVSQYELEEYFNKVKEKVQNINPTTEKTENIKFYIINRLKNTEDAINNAYNLTGYKRIDLGGIE